MPRSSRWWGHIWGHAKLRSQETGAVADAVCFGAQHPTFTVQVLGNLPGGAVIGVWGINNAGEAVGQAGGGSSVCTNGCAVVWQDGTPTALGSVAISGEYDTVGLSINNAGQVVGNVFTTTHSQFTAAAWGAGAAGAVQTAVNSRMSPDFIDR